DARLGRRQAATSAVKRPVAKREAAGTRLEPVRRALLTQYLQHPRMLMAEEAQRHESTRTQNDPIAVAMDLAVSAEAIGAHRDRLDHRLPAGHGRTLAIEDGYTAVEQRDIRRGAAHVDHDDIVLAREMAAADDTGRRPGKDRLDGAGHRKVGRHEGPVALDDHQGRAD